MTVDHLVGKSYTFDDESKIEVIQVKKTDEDRGGKLVTYHVTQGKYSLPRKLIMGEIEFMNTFGHLFKD